MGIQNFGNGCPESACAMLIWLQRTSASQNKSAITGSPAVFLPQDLCPAQSSGWFCSLNAALVIISFHYHSSCFPVPSYSLPLYLVCSIQQLLPVWITLEVPNLTVLTTLTASDVLSLTFQRGREALLSMQQMGEGGWKKQRALTKSQRKSARAGSQTWLFDS